jgi:protein-S-isoprenylcysteine O-methyltransferase Ste14
MASRSDRDSRTMHKKIPRPKPGQVFDQRQKLTLVLLILAALLSTLLSAFSGLLLLLTRLLLASALLLAGLVLATLLLLARILLVRILLVRIVHNLSCFGFSPQVTMTATAFRS